MALKNSKKNKACYYFEMTTFASRIPEVRTIQFNANGCIFRLHALARTVQLLVKKSVGSTSDWSIQHHRRRANV